MTMAIFRRPSLLLFAALAGCATNAQRDDNPATHDPAPSSLAAASSAAGIARGIAARSIDDSPAVGLRPVAGSLALEGTDAAAISAPASEPSGAVQDRERQELIKRLLKQGAFLEGRGQYEDALDTYAQALQLDRNNQVVLDRILKIQRILGDRPTEMLQGIKDAERRERISTIFNKAQAMQSMQEAAIAAGEGDYKVAIEKYEQALVLVKIYSMIQDDKLNEVAIQSLIEATKAQRDKAAQEALAALEQEASARTEKLREEQLVREHSEVERLMLEARTSFRNRHHADAEKALKRVLFLRPEMESARKLLDMVIEDARAQREVEVRDKFKYAWKRAMLEVNQSDLPQQQVIMHDDLEHWREVSKRKPLTLGEGAVATDPRDQEIERRLATVMILPKEIPDAEVISDTLKVIARRIGVDIQVDYGPDEEEPAVTSTKDHLGLVGGAMSVQEWLKLLPNTPSRLHYRVQNGIVKLQPESLFFQGNMVIRFYEVSEIVRNVAFYPTREINLSAPNSDELGTMEEPPENPLIASADSLPDLIKENTGGEAAWGSDEAMCDSAGGTTLVVRHTPEMHARIARLLEDLRGVTRLMVDIESRFLKVEDNFLEDIGVDLRGLGDDSGGEGMPGQGTEITFDDFGDTPGSPLAPGPMGSGNDVGIYYSNGSDGDILGRTEHLFDRSLGNDKILTGSGGFSAQYTLLDDTEIEAVLRAVTKSDRTELVTAPRLLVFNTERANISVMNQVSYVQDFDVEIAQAAAIADPIIEVISDGVILDVTPIVSADRRFITLELRPTVATLARPIPEFTTTLGVGAPVTIQLPTLEIQRIRTTVTLPDGGTLLLGGQHISEKQDYQSGIPILSDLPILSFLFSRKGRFTSNRRLLILLKATIVIPEEHEPDLYEQ